jgi:hypothetical protein
VRVFTEIRRGADNDIAARSSQNQWTKNFWNVCKDSHSINTSLDRNPGIIHVAPDVSENLHAQLEFRLSFGEDKNAPWPSGRACRWPRSPAGTARKRRGW